MRTGNSLVSTNQPQEPSRPIYSSRAAEIAKRAMEAGLQRCDASARPAQPEDESLLTGWCTGVGRSYCMFKTLAASGEIHYWLRRG